METKQQDKKNNNILFNIRRGHPKSCNGCLLKFLAAWYNSVWNYICNEYLIELRAELTNYNDIVTGTSCNVEFWVSVDDCSHLERQTLSPLRHVDCLIRKLHWIKQWFYTQMSISTTTKNFLPPYLQTRPLKHQLGLRSYDVLFSCENDRRRESTSSTEISLNCSC